jgi:hypothetical protein
LYRYDHTAGPQNTCKKIITKSIKNTVSQLKNLYILSAHWNPVKIYQHLLLRTASLPDAIKKEYSLIMAGGNGWKTEKSRKAIDDAKKAGENVVHVGFIDGDDGCGILPTGQPLCNALNL